MAGAGFGDPVPRPAGARLAEATPWARFQAELEGYVSTHGSADVPGRHRSPSGYRLGIECGQYRTAQYNGHLPDAQEAWLDAQPGWWWNTDPRLSPAKQEDSYERIAA